MLLGFGVGCRAKAPVDPVPAHDILTIDSEVLGETRVIAVWQPEVSADTELPTLYMPDGGVKEDFPHIANTVASLIERGVLPPMRVVGIENTDRHRDLTGPTQADYDRQRLPSHGGAAAFRGFIRDELIPRVEARYACSPRRALIGESLAGLFVAETFLREPGLFQTAIAVSPSLWWNEHALVNEAPQLLRDRNHPGALFLTSADERDIVVHADALATALQDFAADDVRWTYAPRPKEHHGTVFRAVKEEALTWALGPWGSQG